MPKVDKEIHKSLSIPTDLDRVYDEFGGPAPIHEPMPDRRNFERYCSEFSLHAITPILEVWNEDFVAIRQHWPWVAFAASQYRFEQVEWKKYDDELKPDEICTLLERLDTTLGKVVQDLCDLQKLSSRLRDWKAPNRRGHLGWMYEFLIQNLHSPTPEIDTRPEALIRSFEGSEIFIKQLAQLRAAAQVARNQMDKSLLTRSKPQSGQEGLYNLAWRSAQIWESLTGRIPSANKVSSKKRDADSPDFVLFVQEIARLATGKVPTRNQIETALNAAKSE